MVGGSPKINKMVLSDESYAGTESLPVKQTRPYVIAKRHGLSEIVRALKSFSARRINNLRHIDGIPVWQRNYYEHIIRNEQEMDRISRYIESNPVQWTDDDDENPNNIRP